MGDGGQASPIPAKILGLPCAMCVIKTSLPSNDNLNEIERELENGFRHYLTIQMPAVLTIQASINIPNPRLSNMLATGQKEIKTFREADLFPKPIEAREIYIGLKQPKKTKSAIR